MISLRAYNRAVRQAERLESLQCSNGFGQLQFHPCFPWVSLEEVHLGDDGLDEVILHEVLQSGRVRETLSQFNASNELVYQNSEIY